MCIQFEVGKWDKSGGIQKAHHFPCFLGASKQNMNFLVQLVIKNYNYVNKTF